jgi:hypothetical protein
MFDETTKQLTRAFPFVGLCFCHTMPLLYCIFASLSVRRITAQWINPDGTLAPTVIAYDIRNNRIFFVGDVNAYNVVVPYYPVSPVVSPVAFFSLVSRSKIKGRRRPFTSNQFDQLMIQQIINLCRYPDCSIVIVMDIVLISAYVVKNSILASKLEAP